MPQRITKQLRALLAAFMEDPQAELYGLELMEVAHISSGTLYPLLHRLVADGWLVRTQEVASDTAGPPRQLYKLTGEGQRAAAQILAPSARRVRSRPGGLAWT